MSYDTQLNYIQKWFKYTDPETGEVTSHSEVVRFNNHYETVQAYKRLRDRLNEPNAPGYEWGVSCPQAEVELDSELAPAAERIQWLQEVRRVQFRKP